MTKKLNFKQFAKTCPGLPKNFRPNSKRGIAGVAEQYAVWLLLNWLLASGVEIRVIGDGGSDVAYKSPVQAMKILLSGDEAHIFIGQSDFIYLVFGNEPCEVVSDYTVTIESAIKPFTDGIDAALVAPYFKAA